VIRKLSLVELGSFYFRKHTIYIHANPTTSIDVTVPHLLDVTVGKKGDMFLAVFLPICLLWARENGVFTGT